jgi:hypothetical protein
MIILGSIIYILLIALSVFFTKDKYNMFLVSNIIFLTTTFLFPFIGHFLSLDSTTSTSGMVMYMLYFSIFFVAYILGRKSVRLADIPEGVSYNGNTYLYLLLGISLLINLLFVGYSLAMYGVQGAFINPRDIYTTTRTGSGQIYYVVGIFFNLYVLLGLFVFRKKLLHFIICSIFALPYGTKGKIFTIVIFNFVYFMFVHKNAKGFRKPLYFALTVIGIPLIMIVAFWYTSVGLEPSEVLRFAIGYGNDYENNFNELVNHFSVYFPHGYLNGKILFGDTIYPFIPRILWHGKPEIFGDIYLSYVVYPEATLMNVGAPSFGALGQPYADFGFVGGLIQISIEQTILGYLLGKFEVMCINKPTALNFLLLITFAFGGLTNLPSTDRLLITILNVIFVLTILYPLKFTFIFKRSKT